MVLGYLLTLLQAYIVVGSQQNLDPTPGTLNATSIQWDCLRDAVQGRLFNSTPFASPCFLKTFDSAACAAVRNGYVDEGYRTNHTSAYIQTQWETCQSTNEQCLLDRLSVDFPLKATCARGSVPSYFVDVRRPEDVTAAFKFSKESRIPLVLKNTGHDYEGRSSAPGSLALWTHNLKAMSFDPAFVAIGCKTPSPAMTVGAGVQWAEAYALAEEHNFTVVGGADRTVGVAGGWLQGGGHGALSNTMGLGVDRVLQFKVVTPDGQLRIANDCQNQDLFFALRGGGGGTFGVVMEATLLTSPRLTLQAVLINFSQNKTLTRELWTILVDNGLKWAADGWGGYSSADSVVLINPILSATEAARSVAPLIAFGRQLEAHVTGAKLVVTEFPSWGTFFEAFSRDNVAIVGASLAIASRLISKDNFTTLDKRSELVSGLLAANDADPELIILITAPASVPSSGVTSVTEAWRSSLYHVTVAAPWNWNATKAEKKSSYESASASIDHLRKITPDAAYVNEADVYEPNHEIAFWGIHYPELLRIKQKYDPDHLLDCWHCVGWNPRSVRFSCYF